MRIKAHILYIFLAVGICVLVAYFLFGATGIFMLDKKLAELQNIESRAMKLRAEVSQMQSDVERLKTDSEYVISSAKSYGYLEGENEKVVRIVRSNNNGKAYSYYADTPEHSKLFDKELRDSFNTTKTSGQSTGGFLPILLISVASILVYLFVKYQINTRKRLKA